MTWKHAVRGLLHHAGGLAALRLMQRSRSRVLMFHEFHPETRTRLNEICEYVVRHFEPVTLLQVAHSLTGGPTLPANAVTVTVDDGYRNFLEHGHPIFHKHKIPSTIYAVAGFAEGKLWLWTDRILIALQETSLRSLHILGEEFDISRPVLLEASFVRLCEILKLLPDSTREQAVGEVESQCKVRLPDLPPRERSSLTWEELRALSSENVEIGCHTYSHPILSRLETAAALDREIRGAKELMETRLGFPVHHFCYPNGRAIDIGEEAPALVSQSGFLSSVTCSYGLNSKTTNPLQIQRVPFDDGLDFSYSKELLAGLHM